MSDSKKKAATAGAKPEAQSQVNNEEKQLNILKLYVQNSSIEVPNVKTIFSGNWVPELNISVSTKVDDVAGKKNSHHVALTVKCDVASNKERAFIVEVTQCGIFSIPESDADTMKHILNVFCPNVLYPYLRESVTDIVSKAGFPQLALAPINFEMMLAQQEEGKKTSKKSAKN